MNNTFYFLRHGETIKDRDIPSTQWSISDEAKSELRKLAKQEKFKDLTHIYSSTELKAQESARPFSEVTGLDILEADGLEEMHRGDKYLSDQEFKELKKNKLENRDTNPDCGETSNEALLRFKNAINKINTNHNNSNILIASHGTVLTLYFSDLKDDFENIFNYWKNLSFGAVGVVKNFEIVEDISNSK
jgi:broad specificity phosphatase PhoE